VDGRYICLRLLENKYVRKTCLFCFNWRE